MAQDNNLLEPVRDSANTVLIRDARNGNPQAARLLLAQTIRHLEAGTPLPKDLAAWLKGPLSQVLNAPQDNKAFGLGKPVGNPRKYSDEYQRLIAEIHHDKPGGKKSKGFNRHGEPNAAELTAEEFGISANKVIEFYERHIGDILEERRIQDEFRDENEEE